MRRPGRQYVWATAPSKQERRSVRRRHVFKTGQIISGDGKADLNCVIHDLSDTGARLRLPATSAVPDKFLLLIRDENVLVPVVRVWRNAKEVGVKFVGSRRSAFL